MNENTLVALSPMQEAGFKTKAYALANAYACASTREGTELARLELLEELGRLTSFAALAPLPEHDVRRIMVDVVPGFDGEGEEVYAKSVSEIEALLTKMGERIESFEAVTHDEAAAVRLRGICDDLGLVAAIPETNEQLMAAQFAVFGMIRRALGKVLAPQAQVAPAVWTDPAILSLLKSNGDGPFGDEDISAARRFMQRAEEIRQELAAPQPEPDICNTCDGRGCPVCHPIPEPQPCAHRFMFFGDQAVRRCADCNQQESAPQALTDADKVDAERWRETLMRVGAARTEWVGGSHRFIVNIQPPPNVMQGSVAQHFTAAIDAARGAA